MSMVSKKLAAAALVAATAFGGAANAAAVEDGCNGDWVNPAKAAATLFENDPETWPEAVMVTWGAKVGATLTASASKIAGAESKAANSALAGIQKKMDQAEAKGKEPAIEWDEAIAKAHIAVKPVVEQVRDGALTTEEAKGAAAEALTAYQAAALAKLNATPFAEDACLVAAPAAAQPAAPAPGQ